MIAEPCTTHTRTRRHYSTSLTPDREASSWPGRSGWTLCGWKAIDEPRAARFYGQPVTIASLPECRVCARKLTTTDTTEETS